MIISIKDIFKMIGVIIMMGCACLFSTLFINYSIDLNKISNLIEPGQMQIFYDAQIMSGKVVVGVAGSCLVITTFVMLLFYIKFYIDNHKSELGILKALGYSNFEISKGFYKFGLSVFIGSFIGYVIAHMMMGYYYDVQLEDGILPLFEPSFNIELFILLVIIPTVLFCVISVIYSYIKLKQPALDLIKGKVNYKIKNNNKFEDISFLKKIKNNNKFEDISFLKKMKKSTIKQKKSLAFFVGFSVFCFSSMMQMSVSMRELTSPLMAWMILGIGLVISVVIMILSMSTLMGMQSKNIGLMRVFGYHMKECKKNILDCYRKIIYISFVFGTFYQYFLLKLIVKLVFKDIVVPEINFNFKALITTFMIFLALYESLLYYYSVKMNKLPIKEIMLESN